MKTLKEVRNHLRKQSDVKSTRIVSRGELNYVKAVIVNPLHDGTNFRRVVYYDYKGNVVDLP